MTLSSKNFRLANDQVRGGMKGNQLFQIGSELLKMERAESRSFSLYIFYFFSPFLDDKFLLKFHDDGRQLQSLKA